MSALQNEVIKGILDGAMDNVKREREEIRVAAIKEVTDQIKPVLESKDAEIARLQTELESKSGLPDGESADDYAVRVVRECIDYFNAGLGYM